MKRCAELRDLSEDHHHGLVLARSARRAADGAGALSVDAAWAEVSRRFAAELLPHFAIEEEELVPELAAAGEAELAARVLAEHAELRRLVEPSAARTSSTLRAFGELLERHIRFEDREVFEVAQERLKRDVLERIARACTASRATRPGRSCSSAPPKTSAIELRALAPQHLLALVDAPQSFEAAFGVPAVPSLRDFFVSAAVSPTWLEALRAARTADVWTHGFAVVHVQDGFAIGCVGFKGPPDASGTVEVAYAITSAYEGFGHGTQALRAALRFAAEDDRVRDVIAHTLPERNASTRVLEKSGFLFTGSVDDPDDGPIWAFRWSRAGSMRKS